MVQDFIGVIEIGASLGRLQEPRPARRGTRLALEQLDDRALLTNYSAATVSALIADINAANTAGGTSTIILTAATAAPLRPDRRE